MNKKIYETTIKELRQLLFECRNQDISIKELRKLLFDCENQERKACEFISNLK